VAAVGWLVGRGFDGVHPLPRLLLLFGGLFTAAGGLLARFREQRWELIERIETAAMVATTGLACLLGYLGMDSDWASGRMLFGALFIASLLAVALVLLPPVGRRVLLSLVLLYHFGGMAVAVTQVDPPGSTGPWVSRQLWIKVYRPYLSFLYLTNAYHFYSPDPGPASLFWFAVCYDDGSYTWVKLPERSNSPIHMHYQRLLAMPEHTFTQMPRLPFNQVEMDYLKEQGKERGVLTEQQKRRGPWEVILTRRRLGSTRDYILIEEEDGKKVQRHLPIPLVSGMAENWQYREPTEDSRRLIGKAAQRILWRAPPADNPSAKVRSVKVYRVTHLILTPSELAKGVDPLEKTKYLPFFLGEYDGKGNLVDSFDPFLYWFLPITYVPRDFPGNNSGPPVIALNDKKEKDNFLLDCLEMHAAGPVRKLIEPDKKKEKVK
jgi:hypothetical protein